MNILITGAAGFIGFHLSKKLLEKGFRITGLDNLNNYYSPSLKFDRLKELTQHERFNFTKTDITDSAKLYRIFEEQKFDLIFHLAAQAGVRYSIQRPAAYIDSNLVGFANILECCRCFKIKHLYYASSSSVYGLNTNWPFCETDACDRPASLYAATKKANELMAHAYAHIYGLHTTGLRFFTVYGSWGRPDMAYYKFAEAISSGKEIAIYNQGDMARDFTCIHDITEAMYRLMQKTQQEDQPKLYRIFNIGNNAPVQLLQFVQIMQEELGVTARMKFLPMQPGDVQTTWADSSALYNEINFKPETPLRDGIREFVDWYRFYEQKNHHPAAAAM